jgi:Spy/CpxP family protein refolding chaperone
MRNVIRVLALIGSVAAAASPSAARADDPAATPAQRPAPPAQQAAPPAQQAAPPAQQAAPPAQQAAPPAQRPAPPMQQAAPPAQQASPPAAGQRGATPAEETQKGASEANGIVQMVEDALSGITLRPDQKDALQKVGAEVDAKVAAVDEAKRGGLLALADQIEAGNVDPNALKSYTQKYVDAAVAASPVVRSGLEKVHEILDASQRKQFVEGFREAMKKHAGRFDKKAHLDRMAATLNLTDDQKQKIGGVLGEDTVASDVARARVELVLAAFPGDHFAIDELLAPASTVRDRVQTMADHMIGVASRITEILTPDQRRIAASHIRDRVSGRTTEGGTGQTGSALETIGSISQGIWVGGGGVGYAGGYRSYSGAAFSGGYAAGYGGGYLI